MKYVKLIPLIVSLFVISVYNLEAFTPIQTCQFTTRGGQIAHCDMTDPSCPCAPTQGNRCQIIGGAGVANSATGVGYARDARSCSDSKVSAVCNDGDWVPDYGGLFENCTQSQVPMCNWNTYSLQGNETGSLSVGESISLLQQPPQSSWDCAGINGAYCSPSSSNGVSGRSSVTCMVPSGSCTVSYQDANTADFASYEIATGQTMDISDTALNIGYNCVSSPEASCLMINKSYSGAFLKAFTYSCQVKSVTTGTINTTANIAQASWTITGPVSVIGGGTYQSLVTQPTGTYTITFDAVTGYSTPPSQTFTIVNQGDTINFNGNYSAPTVDIHFE